MSLCCLFACLLLTDRLENKHGQVWSRFHCLAEHQAKLSWSTAPGTKSSTLHLAFCSSASLLTHDVAQTFRDREGLIGSFKIAQHLPSPFCFSQRLTAVL
jgi:hypothetical protein